MPPKLTVRNPPSDCVPLQTCLGRASLHEFSFDIVAPYIVCDAAATREHLFVFVEHVDGSHLSSYPLAQGFVHMHLKATWY